mmetsp:Transcript_131867/g.381373  ORF Transcript_131867/g.381373 Transcript_131867/m.381373 type:complete len:387 (-) Transcript_131867:2213-3373(-)
MLPRDKSASTPSRKRANSATSNRRSPLAAASSTRLDTWSTQKAQRLSKERASSSAPWTWRLRWSATTLARNCSKPSQSSKPLNKASSVSMRRNCCSNASFRRSASSASRSYSSSQRLWPAGSITMCSPVPLLPLRAVRPKACSSMRTEDGTYARITCRPPFSSNSGDVPTSVPLPAKLVATMTSPGAIVSSGKGSKDVTYLNAPGTISRNSEWTKSTSATQSQITSTARRPRSSGGCTTMSRTRERIPPNQSSRVAHTAVRLHDWICKRSGLNRGNLKKSTPKARCKAACSAAEPNVPVTPSIWCPYRLKYDTLEIYTAFKPSGVKRRPCLNCRNWCKPLAQCILVCSTPVCLSMTTTSPLRMMYESLSFMALAAIALRTYSGSFL